MGECTLSTEMPSNALKTETAKYFQWTAFITVGARMWFFCVEAMKSGHLNREIGLLMHGYLPAWVPHGWGLRSFAGDWRVGWWIPILRKEGWNSHLPGGEAGQTTCEGPTRQRLDCGFEDSSAHEVKGPSRLLFLTQMNKGWSVIPTWDVYAYQQIREKKQLMQGTI